MTEQTNALPELTPEQIEHLEAASKDAARIAASIGANLAGEDAVNAFSGIIGAAAFFMERVFTEQEPRAFAAQFFISAAATAAAKAGLTNATITEAIYDGINDARHEIAAEASKESAQ